MKIHLKRLNDAVLFEATNERGLTIQMEGSRDVGGEDAAPMPTEVLLMSLAGCTAIDTVDLLKKMRQPLRHIEIDLQSQRAEDQVPKIFTGVHIHYKLYGVIKPEKAEKAIRMSVEKYCTVSKMIDHIAKITHSYEIIQGDE